MRVLVVSAHYPPNFVSGGTLQPHRLARGVRDRGHDVSVYAGWLDDTRPAGAVWETVDDLGTPVRWISTNRTWTDWSSDRNFTNPPVTEDFGRHLEAVRPDIAHFHSVQSLGADLLLAARDAGARVIVTMHDFWWCCARQFLVDASYRPCCPVVDAGACQCHMGRAHLERRNAHLHHCLGAADLVLAPSAIAARVMTANGLGPGTAVVVDENGFSQTAPPEVRRVAQPGVLRILYTGGGDRMKGVHVLLQAARLLRKYPGWSLRAFGIERYLAESGDDIEGLPVIADRPFAPDEIDDVFANADVLVVPSVMRETHSLATREALMRGVPVITTDSLGPEEVVDDGVNGFVVASDDPPAIAAAVARLLDEPGLLSRMRAATLPGMLTVRALDEQADGLVREYERLTAVRSSPGERRIDRVLFIVGIDGAPLRYRAHLPAEALRRLGVHADIRHYRDPEVDALADRADAAVVYRVPATIQVLATLDRLRGRRVPLFFDVDDLIFDPELAAEIPALQILPPAEAELWLQGVRRYRTTMQACNAFIGSTPMLCRHAQEVTGLPAFEFPNGIGLLAGQASDHALRRPRRAGPLRIGYLSGTNTHERDWAYVEPAVIDVLDRHPDAELWLVGLVEPSAAMARFGNRLVREPIVRWSGLPALLRDIDVNLAPLEPGSRFNEAKSAIKWLEAALTETPTVASPTEPFRTAIEDGRTGLLADSPATFAIGLDALLTDSARRAAIGRAARREALLRWSPHVQGPAYLRILSAQLPVPKPVPPWSTPVTLHEPPERHRLEPYGEAAAPSPRRLLQRARRLVANRAS